MRRREMILSLAASLLLPRAARSEIRDPAARLGILLGFSETDQDARARLDGFLQQLAELGWSTDHNLRLDVRWAAGEPANMPMLARQLVELHPQVILADTTPVMAAVGEIAGSIPVVFLMVTDPVGAGFVESLARPGGNVTGFVNLDSSLGGKWLEVLREIVPDLRHAAVLFNPQTAPYADFYLKPFDDAAADLNLSVTQLPASSPAEIGQMMANLAATPGAGLVVMPDIFTSVHRGDIIDLAAQLHLPVIYPYSFMCRDGGLASYGIDQMDMFRRSATYVDQILRGARPAEMPVQAPAKFEFVINLKTAKAMGLIVPEGVLARADEVIE